MTWPAERYHVEPGLGYRAEEIIGQPYAKFFTPEDQARERSDTVLAFALRAVEQVISDQSRTNRETINRLWDVLDDPHLNQALRLPQQSRMTRR
jgi:hypothetical protein